MQIVRAWLGFIFMCVGMFMAILDIQVVASSLTTIQGALHIPADRISWIQTAYLMAEVVAIPLTGWLTRAMSLRWMFVFATGGFTLASFACAFSPNAETLIAIRVLQGFCGGMLIPAVFTSAFTELPDSHRVAATAFAGVFAMVAPTVGPWVGGWLTETYSWRWIFLINVGPGVIVTLLVAALLPSENAEWALLRRIDYRNIALAATALGTLELLLKEGPGHHWQGPYIYTLSGITVFAALGGIYRALYRPEPFVNLRRFKSRAFTIGCILSFVLGTGLYGSTYILAIFLGVVRDHTPLEIGSIIMVSGAVQMVAAPVAAVLETRVDMRKLLFVGYGLFALGMLTNGFETYETDFWGQFWPQVMRGAAVMLCILPSTRLALDEWSREDLPDASGMFNLMRNLGGAIGIAAIDTILEQRTAAHAIEIGKRLQAGSPEAAREVGLPVQFFHNTPMPPPDLFTRLSEEPLIKRAAMVESFNEAWLLLGALFVLSLLTLLLVKRRVAK